MNTDTNASRTGQAAHTPTPWTVRLTGDGKRWILGEGQTTWGTHVAEVYRDDIDRNEAKANLTFIVRACNSHAALVASLEWALHQLQGDSGTGESYWESVPGYAEAKDALALAKEGQP